MPFRNVSQCERKKERKKEKKKEKERKLVIYVHTSVQLSNAI